MKVIRVIRKCWRSKRMRYQGGAWLPRYRCRTRIKKGVNPGKRLGRFFRWQTMGRLDMCLPLARRRL